MFVSLETRMVALPCHPANSLTCLLVSQVTSEDPLTVPTAKGSRDKKMVNDSNGAIHLITGELRIQSSVFSSKNQISECHITL